MNHNFDILANAVVAKKNARSLADSISDETQKHNALVIFFALDKLVSLLEAQESRTDSSMNTPLNPEYGMQIQDLNKVKLEQQRQLEEYSKLEKELALTTLQLNKTSTALNKAEESITGLQTQLKLQRQEAKTNLETALNSEKEKSEKAKLKIKEKNCALLERINSLEVEANSLAADLRKLNGQQLANAAFPGKSKGVKFTISEFASPIVLRFREKNYTQQLDGANWHFQVSKNDGISINVGTTVWLMPVLPECAEFRDDWNPKITARLHELMMERAKESHPLYYNNVLLAKKVTITTDPIFCKEEVKMLQKSKLITLFDVVSLTYSAFVNSLRSANPNIEDSTCSNIRMKVEEIVTRICLKHKTAK
ncbi:hypothetical protein NTH44_003602 [Vibrio metoecus]|nr:hypothetical protein [Vibrio cholerae]